MSNENFPAYEVISPKVSWSAVSMVIAIVLVGALNAITPELLDFLGPWAVVAYGAIISFTGVLTAYAKGDPRRI